MQSVLWHGPCSALVIISTKELSLESSTAHGRKQQKDRNVFDWNSAQLFQVHHFNVEKHDCTVSEFYNNLTHKKHVFFIENRFGLVYKILLVFNMHILLWLKTFFALEDKRNGRCAFFSSNVAHFFNFGKKKTLFTDYLDLLSWCP